MKAQREADVQLYSSFIHGARYRWVFNANPRALHPRKRNPKFTGWAPGPVWTGAEDSSIPGFDPRTVQAVASRYTD